MSKYVYIFCVMAWQVVGYATEKQETKLVSLAGFFEQGSCGRKYTKALRYVKSANLRKLSEYLDKQDERSPGRVKEILAFKDENNERLVDVAAKAFILPEDKDLKTAQNMFLLMGNVFCWE